MWLKGRLGPTPFLVGVVIGLLACSVAGRVAGRVTSFQNFDRFFVFIQPQTQFYPTLSELVATARAKSPTDEKTLVVIGSSSILRGLGQNPDDLWSRHLQRLLGGNFVVLNYAIDHAAITAFGAVAFRALRLLYPRTIFVALADLWGSAPVDGHDPYRYLFWDGYYKGLFLPADDAEKNVIDARRTEEMMTGEGAAEHIAAVMDSVLYFRDLWGYVAYQWASPIWADATAAKPAAPRRTYVDAALPNLKEIFEANRLNEQLVTTIVTGLADTLRQVDGNERFWLYLARSYEKAFAPALRGQILAVRVRTNPEYIARLSSEAQLKYSAVEARVCKILADLGYQAIDLGGDWRADDYMDNGHLSVHGGRKLAEAVAERLKAIASNLRP